MLIKPGEVFCNSPNGLISLQNIEVKLGGNFLSFHYEHIFAISGNDCYLESNVLWLDGWVFIRLIFLQIFKIQLQMLFLQQPFMQRNVSLSHLWNCCYFVLFKIYGVILHLAFFQSNDKWVYAFNRNNFIFKFYISLFFSIKILFSLTTTYDIPFLQTHTTIYFLLASCYIINVNQR